MKVAELRWNSKEKSVLEMRWLWVINDLYIFVHEHFKLSESSFHSLAVSTEMEKYAILAYANAYLFVLFFLLAFIFFSPSKLTTWLVKVGIYLPLNDISLWYFLIFLASKRNLKHQFNKHTQTHIFARWNNIKLQHVYYIYSPFVSMGKSTISFPN